MKKCQMGLLFFCSLMLSFNFFAQGKYAGEFKSIIGTHYVHENEIKELKGFKYSQGKMLGEFSQNAPHYLSLEVFTKGKIAVVILTKLIDTQNQKHSIIEVLKIINIPKNYEIRISSCTRKQGFPDESIVAITQSNTKKYAAVKQAFALKDIRFEEIQTKGVNCLNDEMN